VKADIQGQVISVEGTVDGDLTATTSVIVTQTGRLSGDVRAPSVSIVEGANFNGNVVMSTSSTSARVQRPADGNSTAAAGAAN
jgi:cytoskeletal protein CcmA (bactofilin family)